MQDLSYHNLKLLDKLLSPLKKTDPLQELIRITNYYNETLKDEDEAILYHFKKMVEAKLALVLPSYFMFFRFEFYQEKYSEQLQDFLEDISNSIEVDFIEKCINEQNSILEKTLKYYIKIDNNNSINVMRFVSENFLDEYIISSKRKIKFLQEKLLECNATSDSELNPYPFLFVSREVYDGFIIYTSNHIIDFYIDFSYLKKRLEILGLIHKTTDKEFMRFIYDELKLISENRYNSFLVENKLRSLRKSYSTQRENNFNIVFGLE